MRLTIEMNVRAWPFREAMALSRETLFEQPVLQVRLTDENGLAGRGEACGIPYAGETPATMAAQIAAVQSRLSAGIDRRELLAVLPHGGARMAIDSALWDLEAKRGGANPFAASGVRADPVVSAYTIGVRSPGDYERAARAHAAHPLLKIKVDGHDPVAAIRAVRRGAPDAALIVDPNQAWSVDALKQWAPAMAELRVGLLEQPIPVGQEAGLDRWHCPVPLCADELIDTEADLDKASGRFQVVNIKLDKVGGLTAALRLADAAEARGFALMVGCMFGSSLCMAPAMVLAQRCSFADLDGPMLHSEDVPDGFTYVDGVVAEPYRPALWG